MRVILYIGAKDMSANELVEANEENTSISSCQEYLRDHL